MGEMKVRHILGLSGGKDSAALAVLMHERVPEMEYFFCDTHKELDETYDYLERLKARLGIKITYLSAERGFDHWLDIYGGLLPSTKMRWCTKQLKIAPLEKFVGDDPAVSYIGIRADEPRSGYVSTKENITPVFPFKEMGYGIDEINQLLDDSGVGKPKYYEWRSRSGCFFCFFQRKVEWIQLADRHPELFARAVAYEQQHSDGRAYTWTEGETLLQLLARREEIQAEHKKTQARKLKVLAEKSTPLAQVLAAKLDEEEEELGCIACHV
jgi:3'-phosphoadenosine 5'-phosphosulfate sulfotransferase (PAPS reductase)/FAD synthetase